LLEKVLQFYKDRVRTYSLIFRFTKGAYFSFWLSFWLFAGTALLLYFSLILNNFTFLIFIPLTVIALVVVISFLIFNSNAKKQLAKYGIQPEGFLWKSDRYTSYQVKLLQDFLEEHSIQSEAKIKLLIDYLYREAEHNKLPSFVTPSAYLALFIPLWIQFITFVFKGVSSIEMAVGTTMGLAVLILLLITSINLIRIYLIGLSESVFSSESQMMKNLAKLLEDLLLRIPLA
jgi:hypothetical protein